MMGQMMRRRNHAGFLTHLHSQVEIKCFFKHIYQTAACRSHTWERQYYTSVQWGL